MIHEPTLGIDIGTTNSCVASYNPLLKKVEVIVNDINERVTPSVVNFTHGLVGQPAKNYEIVDPGNTVHSIKRIIGTNFNDKSIQDDINNWPFKVVAGRDNNPYVRVSIDGEYKDLPPEFITAKILSKLKDSASQKLGVPVKKAVVTIPARFTDSQREATKQAAEIAGLELIGIINEPTAAAIAYGFNNKLPHNSRVLVFDLGGGTFDASIVDINGLSCNVVATAGNQHLGGDDFDRILMKNLAKKFMAKNGGLDPLSQPRSKHILKVEAENCKKNLSCMRLCKVQINSLINGVSLDEIITRNEFEYACEEKFGEIFETIDKVLLYADCDPDDINIVLLVGGSTAIPKIREKISANFCGASIVEGVAAEEAVAIGAAIFADSTTMSVRSSPRLVVGERAAYPIGIKMSNGLMHVYVDAGAPLPAEGEFVFRPAKDFVDKATILVYEGFSEVAEENRLMIRCVLRRLPRKRATEIFFTVKIRVDADGTTRVSATFNGETTSWEVENQKGRLTKEEMDLHKERMRSK